MDAQGIFIALGANLEYPHHQLLKAIESLKNKGIVPTKYSAIYETTPFQTPTTQPNYLNAVLQVDTQLEPHQLLYALLEIEKDLGRVRNKKFEARMIDLDLLAFHNQVINTANLIIPHPLIQHRAFVLIPWAEIAPNFLLPTLNKTISQLLDNLPLKLIKEVSLTNYTFI